MEKTVSGFLLLARRPEDEFFLEVVLEAVDVGPPPLDPALEVAEAVVVSGFADQHGDDVADVVLAVGHLLPHHPAQVRVLLLDHDPAQALPLQVLQPQGQPAQLVGHLLLLEELSGGDELGQAGGALGGEEGGGAGGGPFLLVVLVQVLDALPGESYLVHYFIQAIKLPASDLSDRNDSASYIHTSQGHSFESRQEKVYSQETTILS